MGVRRLTLCVHVMVACTCLGGEGARFVESHGYTGCVELFNGECRVLLEPNWGGRVLSYRLGDKEALYIDPSQNGWVMKPGVTGPEPCAGRCDIGPEKILPRRDTLWRGRWTAEITGDRSARLTSRKDPATGVRLIRDFELADGGARLTFTQTVINAGQREGRFCHWSRTFAQGGGICLVPLNPHSRYPRGYLVYGPGQVMDFLPAEEPNIRVRNGILAFLGPPSRPKFAIDATEGWLAYLTRGDLLFVKTFPVYPDRVYGEMAANSVSIWYNEDRRTEIEPIGPLEILQPGERFSFTEVWTLLDHPYPADREVDLARIRRIVTACK
jgi:hypothetical protein